MNYTILINIFSDGCRYRLGHNHWFYKASFPNDVGDKDGHICHQKVVTKTTLIESCHQNLCFENSISACCADKCAYYYNLTFNIILCLAFVAGDLYFGIMEDVTWDIAGGALGAVLFVMAIMIGLVCALCTDR